MTEKSSLRTALAMLITTAAVSLLASCSLMPRVPGAAESEPGPAPDISEPSAWVVVIYEDRPERFDGNLMDALLETELAADSALQEAELGYIDGNDVGAHGYELYFVGFDAAEMWTVLEPVFKSAPVEWSRVELRDRLDDPSPTVLTPANTSAQS